MTKNSKRTTFTRKKALILKQATPKAKIKVRLNATTTITLPDISALQLWLVKYPDAKVVDNF
jgi:hypothetical protein